MTRGSYRPRRLWRSITRTRYLLVAAVVIVVVAVSLDHHPPPKGCTFYYDHAYRKTIAGKCIPNAQRPPSGWTVIP